VKVFVVFLHEASHALMAMATGGQVVGMQVLLNESGMVESLSGSSFWTLSAGYLGSLLFGGLILLLSSRTGISKTLAILLGAGMAALTLVYMRNASGFVFGLGFGVFLMIAGIWLPRVVADWLLRGLGLSSCLYAIYDITSDILLRPDAPSDASMLANLTGFPPFVEASQRTFIWGVLWMLIALMGTWFFVSHSIRKPKEDYSEAQLEF
jgi:hypothetical protein